MSVIYAVILSKETFFAGYVFPPNCYGETLGLRGQLLSTFWSMFFGAGVRWMALGGAA
jgi:hypothetical protein